MKFSNLQQNIFAAVGTQNLIVDAGAGCGKTTTMVECANHLSGSILAVAFNKTIATELSARMPAGVRCQTLNAYGFSACRERGIFKLNSRKMQDWCKEQGLEFEAAREIQSAVSSMKSSALPAEQSVDSYLSHVLENEIYIPKWTDQKIALTLREAMLYSFSTYRESIDFDDQLYLPVALNWFLEKVDHTLVDEAQDLSPVQRKLLAKSFRKTITAFGDPRQAIYGFRGASNESMKEIERDFSCAVLPLSETYRCPQEIVRLANTFKPQLRAMGDAKGEIRTIKEAELISHLSNSSDMVVCRNNSPLIRVALSLLNENIPFNLSGRALRQIESFLRAPLWRGKKTIAAYLTTLEKWKEDETAKLQRAHKPSRIAAIHDRAAILRHIFNASESPSDIKVILNKLMANNHGVLLSTIHGVKGLEAPNIYLLHPHLIPAKYAETDEELYAEDNLKYVAYTRALETLTFVHAE